MSLNIFFKGTDGIYNVGGISNTSIIKLAHMIGKKFDVPVIIPKVSSKTFQSIGAPKNDKLDISRYFREFGDKQFISLSNGLDKTIKWQKFIYGI